MLGDRDESVTQNADYNISGELNRALCELSSHGLSALRMTVFLGQHTSAKSTSSSAVPQFVRWKRWLARSVAESSLARMPIAGMCVTDVRAGVSISPGSAYAY